MIKISLRTYSSHIKSLLHFNYPYYAEPGDGLSDDIGAFTWTRSGQAKLAGSEIPADVIISGTPKFGYRCLHTESNSDYITGTSQSAQTLSVLEASLWIRPTASAAGNILHLKSGTVSILILALSADLKLTASSSAMSFSVTSSQALSLNTWTYVRLQVSSSEVFLTVNNFAADTSAVTGSAITFNAIQLGGIKGEIDEFILRDSFTSSLPTEPEKAVCNVQSLGGFGTGSAGNVTLAANCIMNTSGAFTGSGRTITASSVRTGKFGDFAAGNEVMLVNMLTGAYCFRTLLAVSGSTLTLSAAPDSETTGTASQVIQVPNFNTLTVNSGVIISPNAWDGKSGGIVAFRVKGNCTVSGQVITSGKGRPRTDSVQLTHSKILDAFITNTGGGIFITCGGVFTAGSGARLGATWDGSAGAGSGVSRSNGTNGGAGYGGGGGSDDDSNSTGGKGGVGGGGGGANSGPSGNDTGHDAGADSSTGGAGNNGDLAAGGTQGDNGAISKTAGAVSGGGGAGGNSALIGSGFGCSGANIIIITKTLKADSAAISTGGQGGQCTGKSGSHCAPGGGGTGFCYIACERMN